MKDQDKTWAPHMICISCSTSLTGWYSGKRKCMPFALPMIWRVPTNHATDCYFCLTKVRGINKKNKKTIVYPDIPSAMRPVKHSDDLPISKPPMRQPELYQDDDEEASACSDEYNPNAEKLPKLFTQDELDDLVRDLELSKASAELLASRLQEKNLLIKGTIISRYRYRDQVFQKFFKNENEMVYCCDIQV